jgi:hypothetical protein
LGVASALGNLAEARSLEPEAVFDRTLASMAVKWVLALLVALGIPVASADAQSLSIGGAVHENFQRFEGDPSLNRLDGDSVGWMLFGGARFGRWVARGEGSWDSTIRNAQSITLTVRGSPVTIHSELSHRLREVAALGGYAYDVTHRFEVTVVGGVSFVTVHRAFTTDAGEQVLIPPSTVPTTTVTTTFTDRFATWTAGADIDVGLTRHLDGSSGVRFVPLSISNDLSGRSIRITAGLAWRVT